MKCEQLILRNFCQFPDLTVPFGNGLTAVIGPNGSGKSNFLGALGLALTGVNPNPGNKTGNIYEKASATEASYVELVFTHEGSRVVVRRNLRPANPVATLTINDGEPIVGDALVTSTIMDMLTVTPEVMRDIVIVAQEDIYGFLDKTPARRKEQFQRLFQLLAAATVYDAIGKYQKGIEIPAVSVNMDQLRKQILEETGRLNYLTAQLELMPSFAAIQQQRDASLKVRTDYHAYQTATQQVTNAQAAVTNLQSQISTMRETVANALAAMQEADTAAVAAVGDAHEARGTLQQLAAKQQQSQAYAAAATTVNDLQQQLSSLQPPTYTSDRTAAELRAEWSARTAERNQLAQFLDSFKGDVAECPTCGTPVTSLQGKLQEASNKKIELDGIIAELYEAGNKASEAEREAAAYQQEQARLQACLTQAQQTLQSLPVVTVEQVDTQALQQVIQSADAVTRLCEQHRQYYQQVKGQLDQWEGQLTQASQNYDNAQQQLAALTPVTQEALANAEAQIQSWDAAATNRRQHESQYTMASTAKISAEQQLAQAETVLQEAACTRAWVAHLEEMRGTVHKDAAPRIVSQQNLMKLETAVNAELERFGSNFSVSAADGMTFLAHFAAGYTQPVERLSGGQKVTLATSFRLALNRMFASRVGALYLDEPTVYLDETHIKGFVPVLQKLREISENGDLQCIIVTHESSLAPYFDSVISL